MIVRLTLRPNPAIAKATPRLFAQWIFLITGILLVGYSAFHTVARYAYQAREARVFDRALSEKKVGHDSVIGKIDIPRLNISAIVKEGVDEATLDRAVGHIPYTALPGQAGNVGVAAHRDTLFRNLKDVQKADKIMLTTLKGAFAYRVVSFRVVQPTEVSVLDSSLDEKSLTLVTCYPFYFVGKAPKRFVVHAIQVF